MFEDDKVTAALLRCNSHTVKFTLLNLFEEDDKNETSKGSGVGFTEWTVRHSKSCIMWVHAFFFVLNIFFENKHLLDILANKDAQWENYFLFCNFCGLFLILLPVLYKLIS